MSPAYVTVAGPAAAEIEVNRSRFVANVERVESDSEARAVVESARRRHWDARHHCSAYVLGPDGDAQRSNDDGEPAGTAGLPMLEVLRGREVTDVVAVVTRWFGGVLLGSGGLVRAYGEAVRRALDEAVLLRRELFHEVALTLDHGAAARVESELRSRGVTVLATTYAERVTLVIGVEGDRLAATTATLAALTGGAAIPTVIGERWVDVPG